MTGSSATVTSRTANPARSFGHDGWAGGCGPRRPRRGRVRACSHHVVCGEIRLGLLRPVPRRHRLEDRTRQRRQAHLSDGPCERRRGVARGGARFAGGCRYGHGQTRHALSGCGPARQRSVPRPDLRLSGQRRIRDVARCRAERLARRRAGGDGEPDGLQACGRGWRLNLCRGRCRKATQKGLRRVSEQEARLGDKDWDGKITRRRLLRSVAATGAVGFGATILPASWQAVFAAAKPYKIGTMQPLSGSAAIIGKTALVGVQMAVDRINRAGGINGRPVGLIGVDYESNPDVGRRKAEKLVDEDNIDAHVGGVLSNVCLACMPVWEEYKIVNMVGVCLDTTMTTTKCSRYTFRSFDYAPAQAVAFAPYLVNKMGKKWHIAYADYAWGQSTRDAYADAIKKAGGEVVGTTGIPIGTADMTPFLSKISGDFDGLFGIFFGGDGVTLGTQAYDLGLSKKYKFAGDGAIAVPSSLPALGRKIDGFYGIDRYVPVFQGQLDTPHHRRFYDEAVKRLTTVAPQAPVPDRYVQSNYKAMNCLKVGMEKSDF